MTLWQIRRFGVDLPYRTDLPTEEETRAELARWEEEEASARAANDTARVRDCRARASR